MSATIVRIRSMGAPGAHPAMFFSVDGNNRNALDRPLNLSPLVPPVCDFISYQSDPHSPAVLTELTGRALFEDLKQHDNLNSALANTFAAAPADRELQIEIQNVAKSAHDLPWEALADEAGFLALDRDLPFTRVVPPGRIGAQRSEGSFDGTLRVVAVLAADGISGTPQWEALRDALEQWNGSLHCTVLAGDTALRDAIAAEAVPNVEVALVPADAGDLVRGIGDATPHILLLFCHGQSAEGGALEVAHVATEIGEPPLYLTPMAFSRSLRSTWLVMLNACATGQTDPAANTNSFACSLVEEGVPFVTSMRQEVPAGVGHCFTRSFLSRALHDLAADIAAGVPFRPRFAPALAESRGTIAALVGQRPEVERRTKEWTLPILCTSAVPFKVRPASVLTAEEAATKRAAIDHLRRTLFEMELTTPQQALVLARIQQLEAELAQ
jgi:hypothetical protein